MYTEKKNAWINDIVCSALCGASMTHTTRNVPAVGVLHGNEHTKKSYNNDFETRLQYCTYKISMTRNFFSLAKEKFSTGEPFYPRKRKNFIFIAHKWTFHSNEHVNRRSQTTTTRCTGSKHCKYERWHGMWKTIPYNQEQFSSDMERQKNARSHRRAVSSNVTKCQWLINSVNIRKSCCHGDKHLWYRRNAVSCQWYIKYMRSSVRQVGVDWLGENVFF